MDSYDVIKKKLHQKKMNLMKEIIQNSDKDEKSMKLERKSLKKISILKAEIIKGIEENNLLKEKAQKYANIVKQRFYKENKS